MHGKLGTKRLSHLVVDRQACPAVNHTDTQVLPDVGSHARSFAVLELQPFAGYA